MIKYIIQIQEKEGAGMSTELDTKTKEPISNNERIVAGFFREAISAAYEALRMVIPPSETIKGSGKGANEAILAAKKRHGFE